MGWCITGVQEVRAQYLFRYHFKLYLQQIASSRGADARRGWQEQHNKNVLR
jgi:hypothetical protein